MIKKKKKKKKKKKNDRGCIAQCVVWALLICGHMFGSEQLCRFKRVGYERRAGLYWQPCILSSSLAKLRYSCSEGKACPEFRRGPKGSERKAKGGDEEPVGCTTR